MIGEEGYWTTVCEMKRDPELKGPDGCKFANDWSRKFVAEIGRLNRELGELKFPQLTDSMDFMRCVFGKPGHQGSIVFCYLCSYCKS